MLGIKAEPSGRGAGALNHGAMSLQPVLTVLYVGLVEGREDQELPVAM